MSKTYIMLECTKEGGLRQKMTFLNNVENYKYAEIMWRYT